MKIKLNNEEFKQFNGAIIDVELDRAGDARLPERIANATDRIYAFPDEFEVVNENVIPGGYTVVLQAEDLIQLHVILDVLPEYMLTSAVLKQNYETGEYYGEGKGSKYTGEVCGAADNQRWKSRVPTQPRDCRRAS